MIDLDPRPTMDEPGRLRELAGWYRDFAERTGNTTIWESRLRTAEELEAEAERLEKAPGAVTAAALQPRPR